MIVRCQNTSCTRSRRLTSWSTAQQVRVLRSAGWHVTIRDGELVATCERCHRES